MRPFFSVIIPVFNGLKHNLPRCLKSIFQQDFPRDRYEVICIDDCSTDTTRDYLREAEEKFGIIPVFNEVNMRQGGARNVGMKRAQGEYILFIDQDDVFMPGIFADIYNELINNELDVLVMDSIWQIDGAEENTELQHNFQFDSVMSGVDFIEKNPVPFAPWKFCSNRNFIDRNNLFFRTGTRIEDVDWVFRVLSVAQSTKCLRKAVIRYMQYRGQTTTSSLVLSNINYDTILCANELLKLSNSNFEHNEKIKQQLYSLADVFFIRSIRNYAFFFGDISDKAAYIKIYKRKEDISAFLAKFAIMTPRLYSLLTNVISPLGKLIVSIHFWRKYKK